MIRSNDCGMRRTISSVLLKAHRKALLCSFITSSVFHCYVKEMWPPPSASEHAGATGNSQSPPRRSREIIDFSSGRIQASAVPFSWERRPGISKTAAAAGVIGRLLPLPPAPAASHRKRSALSAGDEDPFAVALAECAKPPPGPSIEELFTPSCSAAANRQRPVSSSAWSISDRLGLHAASCKARWCAVADSVVFLPRCPSPRGSASFPYALSSDWSISDRLDLIAASCKATCAVADSAVYVPRRPGPRGSASLPYALSNRGFG